MMRRGLWQQKQKRPSACLLCRGNLGGFGSSSGPYARPALRPSPGHDGMTVVPDVLSRATSLSSLHSTRCYSAAAGRGLGSTADPPGPTRLTAFGGSAGDRVFRRPFSTSGLPGWATQQIQPSGGNDGLLPHERAAREKAMGRTRPAAPGNANPAAVDEAAGRPPAQAKAPQSPKNRMPAWAAAAPSWVPPVTPPSAAGGTRRQPQTTSPPPQQAAPLPFLLPHERAARETAAARSQPQPSSTPSATGMLPAHDDLARNRGAQRNRRRQPFGPAGAPRDPRPGPSTTAAQDDADFSAQPLGGGPRPLPNSFNVFSGRWKQPHTPSFDPPRPASSLAQVQDDRGKWKNLTRRERNPAPALGAGADPRRIPARGSVGSITGKDAWRLMEQNAGKQRKADKGNAADKSFWGWTEQYEKEAKLLKVQRIAREQKPPPAEEGHDPSPTPPRTELRDDRNGRGDRYGREERVDRREKPKKPRNRRRDDQEDDEWDHDFYEERRRRKVERHERERQRLAALEEAGPTPIFLPEYISVANLATALGQKLNVFVRQLEELGFEEVSKDNILTGETAALVAQEYGFEPTVDTGEAEDLKPAPPPTDPSSLPLRPPVVTIMGHVDHGKTTLLDYLRKSSIVAQEHGGITQHIGAFSVNLSSGKPITFLDTPGHAAFLSMRQRGANVTDMVILVVAADDSVMPQTLEALRHARAAKVPIIVAINKIDKPEANVDRVKSDLATHGVEIEDYGGDVQVVCVSGKTGQGMGDLEENILLLSEMLDIRAERDGRADGWVLESTIKSIGRVATVLVKRGTLRPGDYIVAGRVHAKIRSLRNEAGVEVDEAPPGTAVEVLGWKEPPEAGDQVLQAPDEARAKSAVRYRQELKERGEVIAQMAQQEQERRERDRQREREKALAGAADPRRKGPRRHNQQAFVDEDLNPAESDEATSPADTTIYLTFLVKADVHGSAEAVTAALLEQGNNEVRARVLLSAPGHITESDVEHAAISGSCIINFNNAIPMHIKRLAHDAGVKVLDHNVIYHLVEDVRERLAAALPPLVVKKVVGEAEVLQVFPINVKGRQFKNIAGCRIGNGVVKKGSKARVLRGGETVFEGVIETLKHVKKDVAEMKKGSECGISFAEWDELQAEDHIQVIEEHTEKRTL